MMRRALIVAAILAIVASPMAVGNVGFCRSMPCCPPHLGAHMSNAHQPDCCKTRNCEQAPAAGREYMSAKQADHQAPVLLAVAVLPTVSTFAARRSAAPHTFAPLEPRPLHERIALLSVLLV